MALGSVLGATLADVTRKFGSSGRIPAASMAILWDAINGIQGIGDLPGGDFFSEALGVSGDGSKVVGWSTSSSGVEAFLWNATKGMQELDVLLPALGVDLTGWHLRKATAISADGLTIVGEGTNPNGDVESWIAVIPEPGTAILLGLGLVALSSARRSRYLTVQNLIERIDPLEDWAAQHELPGSRDWNPRVEYGAHRDTITGDSDLASRCRASNVRRKQSARLVSRKDGQRAHFPECPSDYDVRVGQSEQAA